MTLLTVAEFAALREGPLDLLARVQPIRRALIPRLKRMRMRKAARSWFRENPVRQEPYHASPKKLETKHSRSTENSRR